MTRGTILLMLAAVAGLTGCNKSGPGTADIAASQAEALAALKALDATIEPAEPNAEQPVTRIELNNDKVTDTTLDYIRGSRALRPCGCGTPASLRPVWPSSKGRWICNCST